MTNPLDFFGYSEEEVKEVIDTQNLQKRLSKESRQICACGHSVKHHDVTNLGEVACSPGRQKCKCDFIKPVIRVPNTRFFMRKSTGNGKFHALTLGIAEAIRAIKKEDGDLEQIEWLVPPICEKCKKENVPLHPTNVSSLGVIVDEPAEKNALLCDDCRF
jgi:hypothetical protein